MHALTLPLLLLAITTASAAPVPINGNLSLEGLSNKIRSGAVAVANPARPSDLRVQRVVSQDGVIVDVDSRGGA